MPTDQLPPDPATPSTSAAKNGANSPPLTPADTAAPADSSAPKAETASASEPPAETRPIPKPLAQALSDFKLAAPPEKNEKNDEAAGADASQAISCPVCGLLNRPGELSCARCGSMLVAGAATKKLKEESQPSRPATWPTGEVIVTDQEPITFEIDGQELLLPSEEVFTVGRMSDIPGDPQPDVDLTPYGAGDKGVSRKHIKIKRKNILVYVADLGSTNGTYLNGRKLIANAERLLRNGDELQLGRLKVRVRF